MFFYSRGNLQLKVVSRKRLPLLWICKIYGNDSCVSTAARLARAQPSLHVRTPFEHKYMSVWVGDTPRESADVKLCVLVHSSGWEKIGVQEDAGNYKGDQKKKLCAMYFMGLNLFFETKKKKNNPKNAFRPGLHSFVLCLWITSLQMRYMFANTVQCSHRSLSDRKSSFIRLQK